MLKQILLIPLLAMSLSACLTVTVRDSGTKELETNPDWREKQTFWMHGFGIVHVNAQEKCPAGIDQMQMKREFTDSLLTGITLGIYSPMTARVWCKK